MPSMRGIEKPHTSASTAATRWPRCASATARFVVTDDLPTPPLPDAIARTRVRESVKGFVPVLGLAALAVRLRVSCCVSAWRSSSVMTVRSTSTSATPGERRDRVGDPRVISARSGQPATVRATVTRDVVAVDRDAAHHVEVDDRAVQLGVLDRAQGFEDFGFGRHQRAPGRISTTAIGRIPCA